jgi:hypothetical protein
MRECIKQHSCNEFALLAAGAALLSFCHQVETVSNQQDAAQQE